MLLAEGRTIFFDDKDKAVDYFSSIGYPCPPLTNPTDYFINIMSIESIEVEDVCETDTDLCRKAQDKVQKIYQEKVSHFIMNYDTSAMSKDPDEFVQGMEKLKLDGSQYNLNWV